VHLWTTDSVAAPRHIRRGPAPGVALVSPAILDALSRNQTWLVYLSARAEDLPALAAPVVAIAADGRLRLLRPPPRPPEPAPEPWLAAAVVLPERRLADLSGGQRVALLDLLSVFSGTGGLRPEQLVALGVEASRPERAALLKWLR